MNVCLRYFLFLLQVMRTRLVIIRQRHTFLKLIGRDQFDPTRENYVSVKLLVLGSDAEFCTDVAKVSVKRYNEFLKTLWRDDTTSRPWHIQCLVNGVLWMTALLLTVRWHDFTLMWNMPVGANDMKMADEILYIYICTTRLFAITLSDTKCYL